MSGQNDFCPKCGALMRDGVCQSCGYGGDVQENPYYTPLVTPPPTTDWRALRQQNAQNSAVGRQGQQPLQNGTPQVNVQQPTQNVMPQANGGGMPPYGAGNTNMAGGYPRGGNFTQKDRNNSNAAIIAICVIAVLVAVFMIVAGIMIQKSFHKIMKEQQAKKAEQLYEYEDYGDYDDYEGKHHYGDNHEDGYNPDGYGDPEDYGVTPDALYYEGLTDSIDYDVDYRISFEEYSSEADENGEAGLEYDVCYVQLEGNNIPNLDELNEQLEYYAKWYVDHYAKDIQEHSEESCHIYTYAYVTYNDEQKLSIVLDETLISDKLYYTDLYSINVDLINGKVLQNSSMLNVEEDFAKEFKEKSIIQNGDDFPPLSEKEILEYLTNEDSVIVFYTPVGLEIGFNYQNAAGYSGWVTVTYKDYQNILALSG